MQRRNRLTRSRDFESVYRQGRSTSTRFLVLYWFPRDDDGDSRLGLAEATEARGFDWLGERLDEVLGKAAA